MSRPHTVKREVWGAHLTRRFPHLPPGDRHRLADRLAARFDLDQQDRIRGFWWSPQYAHWNQKTALEVFTGPDPIDRFEEILLRLDHATGRAR